MAHAHCLLDNYGYIYTLGICNTYWFPTATVVTRTHLSVTIYVHSLSCYKRVRVCLLRGTRTESSNIIQVARAVSGATMVTPFRRRASPNKREVSPETTVSYIRGLQLWANWIHVTRDPQRWSDLQCAGCRAVAGSILHVHWPSPAGLRLSKQLPTQMTNLLKLTINDITPNLQTNPALRIHILTRTRSCEILWCQILA